MLPHLLSSPWVPGVEGDVAVWSSSGRLREEGLLLTVRHSPAQQGAPSWSFQACSSGRAVLIFLLATGPPGTTCSPYWTTGTGGVPSWLVRGDGTGPPSMGCQVMEASQTEGLLATGTDPLQPELVGLLQVVVVGSRLAAGKNLVWALRTVDRRLAQACSLLHLAWG